MAGLNFLYNSKSSKSLRSTQVVLQEAVRRQYQPEDAPLPILADYQLVEDCKNYQKLYLNQITQPVTPEALLCSFSCPTLEPELSRSFKLYQLSTYSFKYLFHECLTDSYLFSALILIEDNTPKFISCKDPEGGKVQGSQLWKITQRLIINLLETVQLPNILFGFDNLDWAVPTKKGQVPGWNQPVPGVVRYVGTDAQPSLLFPTGQFVKSTMHCDISSDDPKKWRKVCRFRDKIKQIPFAEKRDKVFWRGSSTGVPLSDGTTFFLPRQNVVKNFYDQMDVGFVGGHPPVTGTEAQTFLSLFDARSKPHVKAAEFVKHKYLLHMDGHTASWGLAQKLSSFNSAVLWVESAFTYREHFYALLQPWEHYVPVSSGLGELSEVSAYLSAHPELGEAIGQRAYTLFSDRLRPEATYCYITRLFLSLSTYQDFQPTTALLHQHHFPAHLFQPFPELQHMKP